MAQSIEKAGSETVTVWLSNELRKDLDSECRKLGVTRSWVLRRLIKSWLVQRKLGTKKEAIEGVV